MSTTATISIIDDDPIYFGTVIINLTSTKVGGYENGDQVRWTVRFKRPDQEWSGSGVWAFPLTTIVSDAPNALQRITLPQGMGPFDVYARVIQPSLSNEAFASYTPSYTWPPAGDPLADTRLRAVSYGQVLKGLATRRGICGDLSACQAAEAAEYITSAYRQCLEDWSWPEAVLNMEVPVVNGLVTWERLYGADYFEFWTADPDAPSSTACPVKVRGQDALGVRLETDAEAVWAKFAPRPPVFTSEPVVAETLYAPGAVVFDPASREVYECVAEVGALGSALADPSLWRRLRILWLLAEPVKLLALADWLGNSEHERAQAADLRGQVTDKLAEISTRVLRSLP